MFDRALKERQKLACSIFEAAAQRGRLAHAYLLTGRAREDKLLLTRQLAAYLNCTGEQKSASGSCLVQVSDGFPATVCTNCRWIADNAHPQALMSLSGEDTKSGRISVEKSRLLADELGKTSQYVRVVLIADAEQQSFHRPAANALLKTIEEPGPNCLFILWAAQCQEVLSTVVSRCQMVALGKSSAPGLWLPETPAQEALEEMKSQLQKPAPPPYDFSSVSAATATLASTLEWSQRLQQVAELQQDNPSAVIDMVVAEELESLRVSAVEHPALSLYLARLLMLAETTKDQMEHYVQLKTALESFALSCRVLHQEPLRETGSEKLR